MDRKTIKMNIPVELLPHIEKMMQDMEIKSTQDEKDKKKKKKIGFTKSKM